MLDGVAGRIEDMIDDLGRDVIVRTFTNNGAEYDPVLTPSDTSARATITDFSAKETDGSIIQSDDKRAHISSVTTVTKQSKIVDNGNVYNIENLRLIQPGDESFLYIAQLRI